MNTPKIAVAWLAVLMSMTPSVQAHNNDRTVSLFNDVAIDRTSGADVPAGRLPHHDPKAHRTRAVILSPSIQQTDAILKGSSLRLNLFADTEYTATVDRVTTNVNGTYSIRARIDDNPHGYVLISTTDEQTLGTVVVPEQNRRFAIKLCPKTQTHYLLELDIAKQDYLTPSPPMAPPPPIENDVPEMQLFDSTVLGGEMDHATIDVMVVYTPAARVWADGSSTGITTVIAQAMEKAQLTLDNSETYVTMNLVHSAEVDYSESGNASTDLDRLTFQDGYMDQVHLWRDAYGADLVALFADIGGTGGISWQLGSAGGQQALGFSLTRVQQASWTCTHIHEMGHNMGCHHHKEQTISPGPGLYDYSAGWRWVGYDGKRYSSVMTYTSGSSFPDGQANIEAPYFSNPDLYHLGQPTGHPQHGDNARTVRQMKHIIAAYRTILLTGSLQVTLTPQAAVDSGVQWRRVGTALWHDSGHIETDIEVGEYTVEFKDTAGWIAPDSVTVYIDEDQITQVQAAYVYTPIADLNGNGIVDHDDLFIFAVNWLQTDCQEPDWCLGADINRNGVVDLLDFVILAEQWLESFSEPTPDISWVTIHDPGFDGQMSVYPTTNAQYAHYLNDALASGRITVGARYVQGAGAPYAGENFYQLDGPGISIYGADKGAASRIRFSNTTFTVDSGFEDHPVTYVSWYGAAGFADYYGWRLPTETEWQAVAGYTDGRPYPTGSALYDEDRFLANYRANGDEGTAPSYLPYHPWVLQGTSEVGFFGTFGYGTADMAGNVREWTSTSLEQGFIVLQGGLWNSAQSDCRVSSRGYFYPYIMNFAAGFRVCR